MRLLYSASLVIMLIDILTKNPIKNAVILCNGKQSPYVSKDDGYYVFCNLYPGDYKVSIAASGYINKEFDTSIEFGESKKFIIFLSFQSTNPRLLNVPRIEFTIKKNKQILKNQEIRFISKTPEMIKMIQKIKKGDQEVILNVPENNFFIFQNFIYSVICDEKKVKEEDNKEEKKSKEEQDDKKGNDLDDEIAKLEAELNGDDKKEEKDEKNEESDDIDNEKSDNKEKKDNKDDLDDELAKLEAELNDLDADDSEDKDKKSKKEDADKENNKGENKDKKDKTPEDQKKLIKEILFIGYDRKTNAYILEKESDTEIPTGGNFYPYWNLQTDSKGKVVIPLSQKLINNGFIIFEISFDNYMKKRKVNLKKMNLDRKILTVRINFKDKNN